MMLAKLFIFSILVFLVNGSSSTGNPQVYNLQCTSAASIQEHEQPQQPSSYTLIPGKAGQKGAKGAIGRQGVKGERGIDCDQSAEETRFNKFESLINNKIAAMEDKIQALLSVDDIRIKACGFLRQPSEITDGQITASSYANNHHTPQHGRLFTTNGGSAWYPQHHLFHGSWIQVDLGKIEEIASVVTQGRYTADYWVATYSVSYKSDDGDDNFHTIENESGETMVFQGNTDRNTPVVNSLPQVILARYVRINVLTWHSYPEMRFDVLKC